MNPEKMTLKMQEALSSAQSTATRFGHPELRPAHVLSALLEQEGGLAKPIIEKMGGSPDGLKSALDQFLSRQPSVSGSTSLSGSNDLRVALTAAEDEQKSLKDDYLSVEHFLLGLFKKPGELAAIFKAQNLTHAGARDSARDGARDGARRTVIPGSPRDAAYCLVSARGVHHSAQYAPCTPHAAAPRAAAARRAGGRARPGARAS